MEKLVYLGFLILIILSLKGKRWAYIATVILGILYFPVSVGFNLSPKPCQVIFDIPLAIHSLTNYKHIVLFAIFYLMTRRVFHKNGSAGFGWALLATMLFGLVVELLEGITGSGNCRMRDLVPDFAGVLLGQIIYYIWQIASKKLTKI